MKEDSTPLVLITDDNSQPMLSGYSVLSTAPRAFKNVLII